MRELGLVDGDLKGYKCQPMAGLRPVSEAYDHGEEADTNPGDEAADVKHCDYNSSGLDDPTDDEDAACHQDSPASTQTISKRSEKCPYETASRE